MTGPGGITIHYRLLQLIVQNSAQDSPFKDLRWPQHGQEPCFHAKEARTWHHGLGTERSNAGGVVSRFCGFRLPMAGFYQRRCQGWCLPRAFEIACGLLGPDEVSWWKYVYLLANSAPAHSALTTHQLLAEKWTSAAIFSRLEFPELLCLARFASKSPGKAWH